MFGRDKPPLHVGGLQAQAVALKGLQVRPARAEDERSWTSSENCDTRAMISQGGAGADSTTSHDCHVVR
jgi:hypothetical protein